MRHAAAWAASAFLCLLTVVPLPASAQQRFILVMDGSGSMWGQVDGEAKITILRNAMDEVLGRLDTSAEVGVVAFGHREKGNCQDIEEILPPGPFNRETVSSAIRSISPKGKTPLAEGVRFAAEAMRFTEERATVVILGDGRESCGGDPCAMAEELEHLGVDLTVHAIAFDIADEEGARQLQCFATATGGLFLPAGNTAELIAALEEVRVEVETEPEPEPQPEPVIMAFRVTNAATGDTMLVPASWEITPLGGGDAILASSAGGETDHALPPGDYEARVRVNLDGAGEVASATVAFSVAEAAPGSVDVPVEIPEPARMRLVARDVATGTEIEGALAWTFINAGTEEIHDLTAASGSEHAAFAPAEYEVIVLAGNSVGEGTVSIAPSGMTEVLVSVEMAAPAGLVVEGERFPGGSGVNVGWNFTGRADDLVFISPIDQSQNTYPLSDHRRIVVGSSSGGRLVAPASPGQYEVRYFSPAAGGLVHREPITVTAPEVTLSGPTDALAGATIGLAWTGPAEEGDFLFIAPAGWNANQYPLGSDRSAPVAAGSPVELRVPEQEGPHEYRYFSAGAGQMLYAEPVNVSLAAASVTPPALVPAGSVFAVTFQGPRKPGDRLFVASPLMAENRYILGSSAKQAVSDGSPAALVAPVEPGRYEVRYFSVDNGGLLARATFEVGPAAVELDAPRIVDRASTFRLRVSGPEAPNDMVFVAPGEWEDNQYPGSSKNRFVPGPKGKGFLDDTGYYVFDVIAPPEAGRYEIRYYSSENAGVLARRALVVK